MDNAEILKNHVLYQRSWTDWPCQHGFPALIGSRYPRQQRSENSTASSAKPTISYPKLRKKRSESSDVTTSAPTSPTLNRYSVGKRYNDTLAERRDKRATRRKPWTEDVPKIESNKNTFVEIHYEKALPKGRWMEYKQRQYVANPKYGHIYEVRTDITPRKKSPIEPSTWLWEEEYRIWRLEESRGGNSVSSSFSKIGSTTSRKSRQDSVDKPHADLFAQYNNFRLDKQRRQNAASNIQRIFKGWNVRNKIGKLKRNALMGLSLGWPRFIREYKETVTRVQARYGVMKTHCEFNLEDVSDFIEKRERYERVFDTMTDRRIDKLPRDNLSEFFKACDLHPTEGEINRAFDSIFKGSGNTADIVFVLDCSASLGPVNFKCEVNFLKDIIQELDVASDRVRVGLVPYNENVFESFGLTRFSSKTEILEKIDSINFKVGLTRTDLALKMMKEIFQSSRPGVQKICIIVTDGKSQNVNLTLKEARKAQQDNIEIYAIGVGYDVDKQELKLIASSDKNVYTVSDFKALVKLKDTITKRICLGACTLCQHVLPRIQREGFYLSEVLDLAWTIFLPTATGLSRSTRKLVDYYAGNDQSAASSHVTPVRNACRPLLRDEALEVVWSVYPPKATEVDARKSRWIRPLDGATEAWSFLDDRILTETDFRTCLKLVIEARLRREGVVTIPSHLRAGVEEVSNAEEAIEKIEKYLLQRKENAALEQAARDERLVREVERLRGKTEKKSDDRKGEKTAVRYFLEKNERPKAKEVGEKVMTLQNGDLDNADIDNADSGYEQTPEVVEPPTGTDDYKNSGIQIPVLELGEGTAVGNQ